MMVMPGEAVPGGVAPPVVSGVPGAVPVTPVQPAPLIGPPPVSPQQQDFQAPGGSYLYHQSSNERTGSGSEGAASALAAAPGHDVAGSGNSPASSPGVVRPVGYAENPAAPSTAATGTKLVFHSRASPGENQGDPPESLAPATTGSAATGSALRIVGETSATAGQNGADTAPEARAAATPAFRLTVGEKERPTTSGGAGRTAWQPAAPSTSQVTIIPPQTTPRPPAGATGPSAPDSAVTTWRR
jgi:hypothetical protein